MNERSPILRHDLCPQCQEDHLKVCKRGVGSRDLVRQLRHLLVQGNNVWIYGLQLDGPRLPHRESISPLRSVGDPGPLRWQLLAQRHPNTPATQEFTPEQIEAVLDLQVKPEVPERGTVTMGQMVRAIAFLGGRSGSKHRPPETRILVRGWGEVTAYLRGVKRGAKRLHATGKTGEIERE